MFFLFSLAPCNVSYTSFFFNDTATTEIYTLSLHDALPISAPARIGQGLHRGRAQDGGAAQHAVQAGEGGHLDDGRSEEHTSELQSHLNIVCRLLLEKKKQKITPLSTFRRDCIDA